MSATLHIHQAHGIFIEPADRGGAVKITIIYGEDAATLALRIAASDTFDGQVTLCDKDTLWDKAYRCAEAIKKGKTNVH